MSAFAAGLSSAFQGYQHQTDVERRRASEDENAAYQREQRANARIDRDFGLAQRQRQVEAQQRDDAERAAIGGISTTKQVGPDLIVPNDDEGNAMPSAKTTVQRPEYEVIRDFANAAKQGNNPTKYLELSMKADQLHMDDAAQRFRTILASSTGKTGADIAVAVRELYNNDPLGGKVLDVTPLGPEGADITFQDGAGRTVRRQFATAAEVTRGLQAHYDPKNYAAQLAAKQKLEQEMLQKQFESGLKIKEKTAEIEADPTKRYIKAGNGRFLDAKTGQPVDVGVPYGYIPQPGGPVDEDGEPIYYIRGRDGSGGAAGGARGTGRGSKAPEAPIDSAVKVMEDVLEQANKGEAKFTDPDQYATARFYGAKLLKENTNPDGAPKVPPEMAARIAIKIARDPKAIQKRINPATGQVDDVYDDSTITGGQLTLRQGVGAEGVPEDQMRSMAADMLKRNERDMPGVTKVFQAAAFGKDPAAGASLQTYFKGMLEKQAAAQAGPQWAQLSAEQKQAVVEQAYSQLLPTIQTKLDLVKQYTEPPKAERQAPARAPAQQGQPAQQPTGRPAMFRGGMFGGGQPSPAQSAPAPTAEDATQILASGDMFAAMKLQSSPEFAKLDGETKRRIYRLSSGARQ